MALTYLCQLLPSISALHTVAIVAVLCLSFNAINTARQVILNSDYSTISNTCLQATLTFCSLLQNWISFLITTTRTSRAATLKDSDSVTERLSSNRCNMSTVSWLKWVNWVINWLIKSLEASESYSFLSVMWDKAIGIITLIWVTSSLYFEWENKRSRFSYETIIRS